MNMQLCNSKLSGLHPFDNMVIIHCVKIGEKQKGKVSAHETQILEVIFVTITENSFVITNGTQGTQKCPHHWK